MVMFFSFKEKRFKKPAIYISAANIKVENNNLCIVLCDFYNINVKNVLHFQLNLICKSSKSFLKLLFCRHSSAT